MLSEHSDKKENSFSTLPGTPTRRKTDFRRCWELRKEGKQLFDAVRALRQEGKQLFDAVRALRQEELKQLKNKN